MKLFAVTVATALISGWGLLSGNPTPESANASSAVVVSDVTAEPASDPTDQERPPSDAVCVAQREQASTRMTVDADGPVQRTPVDLAESSCGQELDGNGYTTHRHADSF